MQKGLPSPLPPSPRKRQHIDLEPPLHPHQLHPPQCYPAVHQSRANLRQYKLNDEEWWIAEQLHDTLNVLFVRVLMELPALTQTCPSTRLCPDLQGRDIVLFLLYTDPRNGNPSHGSY